MEYIRITKENIDREHICCAMSNNQSAQKKEWMKARFKDGLIFYRSAERGKCFIEYIPAENAWHPI
ncbi:MAG: GNAT family N-acetyltransferase, partial [Erysipelotrichaceae bacterium]|nr:GNAT family N-acetyltransferase [Erysipelotrichaceae bacterium]